MLKSKKKLILYSETYEYVSCGCRTGVEHRQVSDTATHLPNKVSMLHNFVVLMGLPGQHGQKIFHYLSLINHLYIIYSQKYSNQLKKSIMLPILINIISHIHLKITKVIYMEREKVGFRSLT